VFTRDSKSYVTLEQPGLIKGGVRRAGRSSREKELSGKAVGAKEFIPFNENLDHIIFLRGTSTLSGSARETRSTESMLFSVSPVIPSILPLDAPLDVPEEWVSPPRQLPRDWRQRRQRDANDSTLYL